MADNALMSFLQDTFTRTADPSPERSKTSNLKQNNYVPEAVSDVAQRIATNPAVLKSALVHMPEVIGASALNTLAVQPAIEAGKNAKFIADYASSPASFAKVLGHQEDGTPILDDPSKPLPPSDQNVSQFALDVGMAGLGTSFAGGAPRGALGMFAGDSSKLANIYAWDRAHKMRMLPGVTNEEIRKQTGWFVGMDDILRHEIPDYTAKIDTTKFQPVSKGDAITFRGGLQDTFIHPELYKAYPGLKDVEVSAVITNKKGMGGQGSFDPNKNVIDSVAEDVSTLRNNLLHEVQHWVQTEEGFAPGGNPNMGFVTEDGRSAVELFYDAAIQNKYRYLKPDIEMAERLVKADPSILYSYGAKDVPSLYKAMEREFNKYMHEKRYPGLENLGVRDSDTRMYMYRNLAGEIEARDTATRGDIMPDMLHMYPPARPDNALILHRDNNRLVHSYDELKQLIDR